MHMKKSKKLKKQYGKDYKLVKLYGNYKDIYRETNKHYVLTDMLTEREFIKLKKTVYKAKSVEEMVMDSIQVTQRQAAALAKIAVRQGLYDTFEEAEKSFRLQDENAKAFWDLVKGERDRDISLHGYMPGRNYDEIAFRRVAYLED